MLQHRNLPFPTDSSYEHFIQQQRLTELTSIIESAGVISNNCYRNKESINRVNKL